MAWVSPEQIEKAKEVDILDYLFRHEPDNLKRESENRYTLRDHDSFVISNGKWCWNSRQIGCETGTALNYLIHMRGYKFTDAVLALTDGAPFQERPSSASDNPKPEKKPFRLPPRNFKSNKRAIAYLRSRGIDRRLILDCIERGLIYEDAKFHNCVFTGKNEAGQTRFACVRSTTANYRGDVDGSDKRFGFLLPPKDPGSHNIACFEAPIDALSHQTMCESGTEQWDGWRLALSGGSLHALKYFLEHHPNVDAVFNCADMDAAGQKIAERMWSMKDTEYPRVSIKQYPPLVGKDWNDALQAFLKMEREQGRPAVTNRKEGAL